MHDVLVQIWPALISPHNNLCLHNVICSTASVLPKVFTHQCLQFQHNRGCEALSYTGGGGLPVRREKNHVNKNIYMNTNHGYAKVVMGNNNNRIVQL